MAQLNVHIFEWLEIKNVTLLKEWVDDDSKEVTWQGTD